MKRPILFLALPFALATLLAGCGGGGSSTTSAADWASGYCGGAATWVSTLDKLRGGIKAGDPTATPSDAVQQLTFATNDFAKAIDDLGQPDTPDGSTSEATAKNLSATLQGRVARAQTAIDSNNPDMTDALRAKIAREQVTASLAAVTGTTAQLAKDDSELGTAMDASSSCADLKTALEKAA